ncbi:heat shock 70 kDa protein 12A-like [Mytilus californianus]|uniref:heat shock 70 kDa protein 12A-like n=1 Tax=Mytilus californianus TaxID=6549 RepID=UPI002247624F|nr:heat shock 70 kDa protein 12A-like [Mytilus californianus]
MYAIDVFGLVISYLKNHLLDRLKGNDSSSIVGEEMIHWVLTVPAIWSDKAKQFMRKAAAEASIPSKSLTLALEPEAASLFCKTFQHAVHGNSQAAIRKGSKYLLIDLGGGTVDITAHKVHIDGTLQELYQATGGRWGGTTVDSEFQLFLFRIFGQQVMEKAYRKYPNEMLELSLDFEVKKRVFEPKQSLAVAIKIPVCLHELFYEINSLTIAESVQSSTMKHTVELKRDKMMIAPKQFYNFFDSSLSCIVNHVNGLLQKQDLSSINTILLVGGFAESHVVKEVMRLNFPDMRIVNPDDCSLSVLKGAVLFGHDPQAISSRICRYTYELN